MLNSPKALKNLIAVYRVKKQMKSLKVGQSLRLDPTDVNLVTAWIVSEKMLKRNRFFRRVFVLTSNKKHLIIKRIKK